MDTPERISSAILRADLPRILDRVKNRKEVIIIRRNNIDECAMVPVEFLEPTKKKKQPRVA